MSASYWYSTQRNKWQMSPLEITEARGRIAAIDKQLQGKGINVLKYDTNFRIYLHQCLQKLGIRMSMRQIVMATAEVYLTRFLLKVSPNELNIYMLLASVLYLASKSEESPVHIRSVLMEARNCWPEFIPNDFTKLAELEFYVMEELSCYVVVHHPYRSLVQLGKTMGIMDLNNAWAILNDSYITDVMLLYPPHVIAIAAVCITVCTTDTKAGDLSEFMANSNIRIEEVAEVCNILIGLHASWTKYDESAVKNAVKTVVLGLNFTFS